MSRKIKCPVNASVITQMQQVYIDSFRHQITSAEYFVRPSVHASVKYDGKLAERVTLLGALLLFSFHCSLMLYKFY